MSIDCVGSLAGLSISVGNLRLDSLRGGILSPFFQACCSVTYVIILVIVHILRISYTKKKSNVNAGEIQI